MISCRKINLSETSASNKYIFWIKFFLVFQLICILFIGPVYSEDAEIYTQRDLRSLSIEELMKIEVATVYGASRYEQKVTEDDFGKDKKILIRRYNRFTGQERCEVLFICRSEKRHLEKILNTLKGMNVLTIGDTKGFAQEGVIINFYIEKDKVRFEINKDAADRAGLKISSRLLSLARIIYGDER